MVGYRTKTTYNVVKQDNILLYETITSTQANGTQNTQNKLMN
ncbi:MAG: hypothetical protein KatS3mg084_0316 [Candidatus Dojkabacteria bacterium]|nr:MAG: hypothetical protein KatS3mg084_0316 [Candidatus Dojkabacteria bacterium]